MRSWSCAAPVALFALAACSTGPTSTPSTPARAAPTAQAAHPVRFVEDDFEGALEAAKHQGKLVFVDAWAPWCHTCLSMRDVVLRRPELQRFERDFVFVAVDTDRPSSEGFAERYRMRAWPTFFVIDPRSRGVLAMYGGSMSLEELSKMLEGALAARAGTIPGERELVQAHEAYGKKDLAGAARLYEDAATRLPDARRGEALVGAIRSLYESKDSERCVAFGSEHAKRVSGSSAPSDFVLYMKECAEDLSNEDAKAQALRFVEQRLRELVASPPSGASVDDRADTIAGLAELARARHDDAEARALEERRLALLEAAARAARTPAEAQTYDYQRMNAYLALGRGQEAVTMFEQRIRELPESYEAHARLGSTLLEMGRAKEAVGPLDRAIELSYGPRRLGYLAKKAKAQSAAGDHVGAIATLQRELEDANALPPGQRDPKRVEDVEKRLAAERAKARLEGAP